MCGLLLQTSSVVCGSLIAVNPAKMTEPIEMPFGLWTRVNPRNNELGGVQILVGKSNFWEAPTVK